MLSANKIMGVLLKINLYCSIVEVSILEKRN